MSEIKALARLVLLKALGRNPPMSLLGFWFLLALLGVLSFAVAPLQSLLPLPHGRLPCVCVCLLLIFKEASYIGTKVHHNPCCPHLD